MDYRLAEKTVARLLELPSPFEQTDWLEDNVAYLDDSGFDHSDVAGLTSVIEASAIEASAIEASAIDSAEAFDVFLDDDEGAATITAWRLLGKLKATETLPTMLHCLAVAADSDDDDGESSWETSDLPEAMVLLGPDVAEQLMSFVDDASHSWVARVAVLESLHDLGERHPSVRQRLSSRVVASLEKASANHVDVNTQLMNLAVDWQMAEAAEAIERAFSLDRIDVGFMGSWDEVRREFDVEGLGLAMPEKPYNSLDNLRRNFGVGCFSDKMLFNMEEIDEKAVDQYLDKASRAFSVSDEGRQHLSKGRQPGYVRMFLEIAIHDCSVTVDTLTMADAEEVLLEIFPSKVNLGEKDCENVICEIAAFWRFIDQVHDVEHAAEIASRIAGLTAEFRDAMTNPSNFGMAKSMWTMGDQAGFDMTSPQGLDQFMDSYNQSLLHADPPDSSVPPPISIEQKQLDLKNRKKLLAKKTGKKK